MYSKPAFNSKSNGICYFWSSISLKKMKRFLQQINFRSRNIQSILATNVVLIVLAVILEWDVAELMFMFWIENIVLGFYGILKIIFFQGPKGQKEIEINKHVVDISKIKYILVPFFIIHFGFFCFIHGSFIEVFFGNGFVPTRPQLMTWDNVWTLKFGILAIFINYGISFIFSYLGKGEFRTTSFIGLLINPYRRIFIIQFMLMGSGIIFILCLSQVPSIIFILFFFIVKLALDLRQETAIDSGELPKFLSKKE